MIQSKFITLCKNLVVLLLWSRSKMVFFFLQSHMITLAIPPHSMGMPISPLNGNHQIMGQNKTKKYKNMVQFRVLSTQNLSFTPSQDESHFPCLCIFFLSHCRVIVLLSIHSFMKLGMFDCWIKLRAGLAFSKKSKKLKSHYLI